MAMRGLTGKVALITGGAQGIGKGIAQRLVAEGMRVALFDTDGDALMETLNELGGNTNCIALCGDVSVEHDVRRAVGSTVNRLGRLDALVNNAGIAWPYTGPIENLDLAQWNRILAVNLTGAMLCAKHAASHLRATKGNIVSIASTRALQSEASSEAYAASKGGLVALTHALAASFAHTVRVNCICPGWIEVGPWKKSSERTEPNHADEDRDQHWAGRVGTPDDIAALTAFLLSEESGFITGQSFSCDGGMTKKMIYVNP